MQTFMPYPNFEKSLDCLDYKRLGKQRVEAMQILNVLDPNYNKKGWINHPCVRMWKGYENALKLYYNIAIDKWIARGYNNTMKKKKINGEIIYPPWFGNKNFHKSHQSNLIRKLPEHYKKYFPDVPDNLEYIWR